MIRQASPANRNKMSHKHDKDLDEAVIVDQKVAPPSAWLLDPLNSDDVKTGTFKTIVDECSEPLMGWAHPCVPPIDGLAANAIGLFDELSIYERAVKRLISMADSMRPLISSTRMHAAFVDAEREALRLDARSNAATADSTASGVDGSVSTAAMRLFEQERARLVALTRSETNADAAVGAADAANATLGGVADSAASARLVVDTSDAHKDQETLRSGVISTVNLSSPFQVQFRDGGIGQFHDGAMRIVRRPTKSAGDEPLNVAFILLRSMMRSILPNDIQATLLNDISAALLDSVEKSKAKSSSSSELSELYELATSLADAPPLLRVAVVRLLIVIAFAGADDYRLLRAAMILRTLSDEERAEVEAVPDAMRPLAESLMMLVVSVRDNAHDAIGKHYRADIDRCISSLLSVSTVDEMSISLFLALDCLLPLRLIARGGVTSAQYTMAKWKLIESTIRDACDRCMHILKRIDDEANTMATASAMDWSELRTLLRLVSRELYVVLNDVCRNEVSFHNVPLASLWSDEVASMVIKVLSLKEPASLDSLRDAFRALGINASTLVRDLRTLASEMVGDAFRVLFPGAGEQLSFLRETLRCGADRPKLVFALLERFSTTDSVVPLLCADVDGMLATVQSLLDTLRSKESIESILISASMYDAAPGSDLLDLHPVVAAYELTRFHRTMVEDPLRLSHRSHGLVELVFALPAHVRSIEFTCVLHDGKEYVVDDSRLAILYVSTPDQVEWRRVPSLHVEKLGNETTYGVAFDVVRACSLRIVFGDTSSRTLAINKWVVRGSITSWYGGAGEAVEPYRRAGEQPRDLLRKRLLGTIGAVHSVLLWSNYAKPVLKNDALGEWPAVGEKPPDVVSVSWHIHKLFRKNSTRKCERRTHGFCHGTPSSATYVCDECAITFCEACVSLMLDTPLFHCVNDHKLLDFRIALSTFVQRHEICFMCQCTVSGEQVLECLTCISCPFTLHFHCLADYAEYRRRTLSVRRRVLKSQSTLLPDSIGLRSSVQLVGDACTLLDEYAAAVTRTEVRQADKVIGYARRTWLRRLDFLFENTVLALAPTFVLAVPTVHTEAVTDSDEDKETLVRELERLARSVNGALRAVDRHLGIPLVTVDSGEEALDASNPVVAELRKLNETAPPRHVPCVPVLSKLANLRQCVAIALKHLCLRSIKAFGKLLLQVVDARGSERAVTGDRRIHMIGRGVHDDYVHFVDGQSDWLGRLRAIARGDVALGVRVESAVYVGAADGSAHKEARRAALAVLALHSGLLAADGGDRAPLVDDKGALARFKRLVNRFTVWIVQQRDVSAEVADGVPDESVASASSTARQPAVILEEDDGDAKVDGGKKGEGHKSTSSKVDAEQSSLADRVHRVLERRAFALWCVRPREQPGDEPDRVFALLTEPFDSERSAFRDIKEVLYDVHRVNVSLRKCTSAWRHLHSMFSEDLDPFSGTILRLRWRHACVSAVVRGMVAMRGVDNRVPSMSWAAAEDVRSLMTALRRCVSTALNDLGADVDLRLLNLAMSDIHVEDVSSMDSDVAECSMKVLSSLKVVLDRLDLVSKGQIVYDGDPNRDFVKFFLQAKFKEGAKIFDGKEAASADSGEVLKERAEAQPDEPKVAHTKANETKVDGDDLLGEIVEFAPISDGAI